MGVLKSYQSIISTLLLGAKFSIPLKIDVGANPLLL